MKLIRRTVLILALEVLPAAADVLCITPGPNPTDGTPCSDSTFLLRDLQTPLDSTSLFTYTVDETGGVTFKVPVVPGDVVLCEVLPCDRSHSANWSDVLNFTSTGPTSGIGIMVSDLPPAGELGAALDIGLPTIVSGNAVFLSEVGPEGANGATYNNGASIGTLISDVPEPSYVMPLGSALAAGLGAAVLGLRRRTPR